MNKIKNLISDRNPFRLMYHKTKAIIAAIKYGFPANKLIVIGITGTNGKTTSVNLLTNILNESPDKVGMTSTINFQVGNKKWANTSKQSTLGPFKLQKLLKDMVTAKCKYAIIEVTSHAITQGRILGINFDIAAITNITQDHIEYHGGLKNYINTKSKLFKKVSKSRAKAGIKKSIILNKDDKYYQVLNKYNADKKITFGLNKATISATDIKELPEGSIYKLTAPNKEIEIKLKIPGKFNIYNSLTAASIAIALDIPLETIQKGLIKTTQVAGRHQHIRYGQKYSIIVDYAHTAESLENTLALYKNLTKGKTISVFGATGGGRDKIKRKDMGRVAHENSDIIILTNDDPYEEDQIQIIDQISTGIPRKEGQLFWKIPNRKEAIRLALTIAKKNDTVVITGKGAEEIMMIDGKKVPYNDEKTIKELLSREVKIEIPTTKQTVHRANKCING